MTLSRMIKESKPLSSPLTHEKIYKIFSKVFSDDNGIVSRYRFTMKRRIGNQRFLISMGNRNNDVVEVNGIAMYFRDKRAYYALKQDERLCAIINQVENAGRLRGIKSI